MEAEKIRPVARSDRPFLISPRRVWSKPWVCGKGLQRTAGKPLADRLGALLITDAMCSGTHNDAYLARPLSQISGKSLRLVFKNKYLANADHADDSLHVDL